MEYWRTDIAKDEEIDRLVIRIDSDTDVSTDDDEATDTASECGETTDTADEIC